MDGVDVDGPVVARRPVVVVLPGVLEPHVDGGVRGAAVLVDHLVDRARDMFIMFYFGGFYCSTWLNRM